MLASSACADSDWNRSASWLSTSAARSWAARARSSAALAWAASLGGGAAWPAAGEQEPEHRPEQRCR